MFKTIVLITAMLLQPSYRIPLPSVEGTIVFYAFFVQFNFLRLKVAIPVQSKLLNTRH